MLTALCIVFLVGPPTMCQTVAMPRSPDGCGDLGSVVLHVGVSENGGGGGGTLLGVLILRESYYVGSILGVPYFRKPPHVSLETKSLTKPQGCGFDEGSSLLEH